MNDYYTDQHLNTTVNGFCFFSDEELVKVKELLELKSDIKLLKAIQKYFANNECRDPGSEEIAFIDRFASSEPRNASNNLITEIYAENSYIGETYKDIKDKLSSLGKNPPYSFEDICLSGELCCSEFCAKKHDTSSVNIYSGDSALLEASISGSAETMLIKSKLSGNSAIVPHGNRTDTKNTLSIESSDSIIFVNPASNQISPERLAPILSGLIISLRSKVQIKSATLIQGGSLLDAVLSLSSGAFINLTALPGMTYNFSAATVLDRFENCAIVIASSASTNEFLSAAKEQELGTVVFGHPSTANRLTISTGVGHPVSLSTAFLSEISRYACHSVSVKNTEDTSVAPSSSFSIMGLSESLYANYVAVSSNLIITNAKKICRSYGDAIGIVLEALSRLISCGVSRKDITASFEATVNPLADKETLGESLSILLGLYRTQVELAIQSVGSSCRVSCTPSISVTMTAPTPEKAIPNTFSHKESRVYLLTPRTGADGITEFRDVKLLLDYIEELNKYGLILSCRAINGKDVIGTVKSMENESVKLNLDVKNVNLSYAAFIIESKNELQGTFLGFTE